MKLLKMGSSFITLSGMKLVTSPQAQKILEIEGKPINWRTFMKLVEIKHLEPSYISPQGTKFWDKKKIENLRQYLPSKRIHGPVGWFNNKDPK
jgi:hypothetical protein